MKPLSALLFLLALSCGLHSATALVVAKAPKNLIRQPPSHHFTKRDDSDSSPIKSLFDTTTVHKGTAANPLKLSPNVWIVEFTDKPVIDGGNLATIQATQAALKKALTDAGIAYEERLSMTGLVNALSITLKSADDVDKIAALPDSLKIKSIWPMVQFSRPKTIRSHQTNEAFPLVNIPGVDTSTPTAIKPLIHAAVNMTGAGYLQNVRGITGKGVRVGVIDSGIDYLHPALGGCFGPGCRVSYGYDFVGDDYNAGSIFNKDPKPDEDPMDCGGHGTHVAGIIGGNGERVVGVAPNIEFGAYRVFGCAGSTESDIIVAAMERAWLDGMSVINLSLGGGSSWPDYPTARAGDRLAKKGMIVVAAIGNDGAHGLFQTSAPSVGKNVISVASFDNAVFKGRGLKISIDGVDFDRDVPLTYAEGKAPAADFAGEVVSGATTPLDTDPIKVDDGCSAYPDNFFDGKAAILRRGVCAFNDKVANAVKANASAILFVNNAEGALTVNVGAAAVPYFGIQRRDGNKIFQALANNQTVSFRLSSPEDTYFPNPTGATISAFSSWGLGPDLDIKPDIGAPGGLIFSTYPLKLGGYATLSGTSMATPHVAGCVALYLQRFPRVTSDDLRTIFQNTAQPSLVAFTENTDSVARQGAGMVQIDAAVDVTTRVAPSKLVLRESPIVGLTKTTTFTVSNTGTEAVNYFLSHLPAVSISSLNPSKPLSSNVSANVVIYPSQFTLAPGQSRRIVSFITPSDNTLKRDEFWIYSGYIRVQPFTTSRDNSKLQGKNIYVPYAGLKGDYEKRSYLPPTNTSLPYIRRLPDNTAFGLPNATVPMNFTSQRSVLVYRLTHPSPSILIQIVNATTNETIGIADELKLLGRNRDAGNVVSYYEWNGSLLVSPPGSTLRNSWEFAHPSKLFNYISSFFGSSSTQEKPVKARQAVSPGSYRLVMKIEKAPGAWWSSFVKYYEYWTSPVIEVSESTKFPERVPSINRNA